MKAKVITTMDNGSPKLPPMDAEEGGLQLHYVEGGVMYGGYSIVEWLSDGKVVVEVYASKATHDTMKKDKKYTLADNIK